MINYAENGNVGTITLSHAPVNAMNVEFIVALNTALDVAEAAKPTVLVIKSDQKCFCAGADLGLIAGFFEDDNGTDGMIAYVKTLHDAFNRIENFPAVTLAVINGPALGGGLEMALACDLRIASASAKIGLPEAQVGMIPGAGGTQRLPRLVGPGGTARLILSGDVIDGTEAERIGIAQWVAAPEALDALVGTTTNRIAGLSLQALMASKDCIAGYYDPEIDGFALELEKPLELIPTAEARNRVLGFFKR
ncbi:MAG: enoyl-CoA hydratase/isomerase family protein [Rhizobiales bacterium]|nr:enoyl-CoA hydratase/isomerase family protein [Hyphomicrobiales bacterium]